MLALPSRKIQEEDAKENLRLMKKMFGVEDVVTQAANPTKKEEQENTGS